jgi:hypothetical protein
VPRLSASWIRPCEDRHLGRRDRETPRQLDGHDKLIIQIPCLNEAQTLPATLADLPTQHPGIDVIEVLVIDDGRATGRRTSRALRRRSRRAAARNKGWPRRSRRASTRASRPGRLHRQHRRRQSVRGTDIPKLLAPLLRGEADICIGDRNIAELAHVVAQAAAAALGSWVVRQVSNTTVPDTTSGFRAYTREAALRMTIVSEFSYTLESIIQAGKKRMAIAHVPIAINPRTRESRLFDSIFSYIKRSGATIVRIYAMYEPLKVFTYIGLTLFGAASSLAALPLLLLHSHGGGYLQSLICRRC